MLRPQAQLPELRVVERGQLVIHSDFQIPKRHRIIEELVARRDDISSQLDLPVSDEPIDIFVFDNEERFLEYVRQRHPAFPNRRALFVKNDTTLTIFAFWGDRVAEDLRHEVTHGYVHSVVPGIPLWLDEGLAEYFEVPRGESGFNAPHIYLLARKIRRGEWEPDLESLENLDDAANMTQLQYAESWLWIHFLLEYCAESRTLLQMRLAEIRQAGHVSPEFHNRLSNLIPGLEDKLLNHLRTLSEQL